MIFSILAVLTLFISICLKDRKKSLYVQSISCLFEAIYDLLISAFTGALINIVNYIRTFLFMYKEKFGKTLYFFILVFFEGVIMANCYLSWAGYVSLLPTIGSIIRTYCLWQSKMFLVRLSGVTTGIFYGLYYIYYHSWFMIIGDVMLIIIGLYAIYQNDIKKINNNKIKFFKTKFEKSLDF